MIPPSVQHAPRADAEPSGEGRDSNRLTRRMQNAEFDGDPHHCAAASSLRDGPITRRAPPSASKQRRRSLDARMLPNKQRGALKQCAFSEYRAAGFS